MSIIGSSFALGIVILISLVYFRNKYFLSRSSKYYIASLILTIAAALANISKTKIVKLSGAPLWSLSALATLSQLLTVFTTAALAIYLISKVTEHIPEDRLKVAKISLISILAVYSLFVIANLFTGWIFSVSEAREYIDGPVFFLRYAFILLQLGVVCYYFIKHRKRLSKAINVSIYEAIPMIVFCVVLKFLYPEMSVFLLAISLIELVFFLNFQNYRNGINTLTKLNDGRGFFTEIGKRKKCEEPFKAYVIKIKNLGIIKQNYGHRAGDEMLYLFSFSLDRLFTDGIPFHMYGTTFALILSCDENGSPEQTEKLTEFLETEIKYMNQEIKLDYILAEHVWEDEATADTFYEKLEYATDIAKAQKLKYIKCSLELEINRLRRKYLINRLQTIDRASGYEIWFQPIYSVKKNAFSSIEVLLRLKERNGSFISPAEFIPIAEKTGQIIPITWFVIEETCYALSSAPELDGIRASINLPMLHLVDPTFEERLNRIVDGYGISHDRISFEFTERVILDDLDVAEKNMKQLAESGYTFYLDDFGVGYSNFNCVLKLPLKTVKLDLSLTSTAEKLKENYGLVYILTDLFHDMGLNVVAEGAETAEQVELLKAYGVDGIQGYFYAKPMPLKKLCDFLAKPPKEANN